MSIEQEVAELAQSPLFAEVDPARLRLLAMGADRVLYRAGETLIRKGEPAHDVLIVLTGKAACGDISGGVAMVGAIGALLRKPHPLSVVAETDIVALRLGHSDFMAVIEGCPQTGLAVMRELARILDRVVCRSERAISIA